jgi:phenylalanyl-tRNA synthetase beta chain
MDILISDNWLRDYLKTKASPKQVAKCLSLGGPSVNKIEKTKKDTLYHIEVTTNRVDSASIYGIAREASAILPSFGIEAKLKKIKTKTNLPFVNKVSYLEALVDQSLCPRFTAVLIKDIKIGKSPKKIEERLRAVGVRPINNVVDISNYIMHELGQPVHTFDYEKIKGQKMILRKSKKDETIVTLDGQRHILPGKDIVIEDGKGRLIDLAGIMGGLNSAVDEKTKNVLLFVQTYNPVNIRRTSMYLAKRTEAAVLFEKGLDPELVSVGIKRGIELFVELAQGKPEKQILDIYKKPHRSRLLKTTLHFIEQRLGVNLEKEEITSALVPLGFKITWNKNELIVNVPSFRAKDIKIPEDIVEEVARIHGYHNLPSILMEGRLPDPLPDSPFDFEMKIKLALKGWGGTEVYTYSMVAKELVEHAALRIKNPLGKEREYMRTSLRPSLVQAAKENSHQKEAFHLFEMANIYLPRKGGLPEEKMTLAGIFSQYSFRQAKGIIEALLDELNIKAKIEAEDSKGFLPSQRIVIKVKNKRLGEFGVLEDNQYLYYEFDVEALCKAYVQISPYKPIPKYPPQIEDLTLVLPAKTRVIKIVENIKASNKLIKRVELIDIFKGNTYTFRIWYQHPQKTLTDKEVQEIRSKILKETKEKFGARLKN